MSARRAAKVPSAAEGDSTGRTEAAVVVLGALVAASTFTALRTADPTVAAVSVASSLVVPGAAAWSVLRRRPRRVTSADRVTLVRVALTGPLTAALVLAIADELPARTWTVLVIAAGAAVLDAVDGWVARHTGGGTEPGARFDPEADAAALLVLSGLLALTVGWWVLLIGLMRYLFAAAAIIRPAWRRNLAISGFRKAVAAGQATALVVGLAPVVPVSLATVVTVCALGALCISFGRDVFQLERTARTDGSASGKQEQRRMEPSCRSAAAPARPRDAQRAFIVPGDLPGPSGGSTYNRHVLKIWEREGLEVAEEQVAGAWPHPDDAGREALGELLGRYRQVLIDGLIASAAPDQIAHAEAAGVQVTVLVHLPLPAETGLTPAQQNAAEAAERHALQHAAQVVCTSEWARRDLTRRYGVVPAAVAIPGAEAAPVARGSSPPHLLFLAAVSPRKNPLLLLRALQPLKHLPWRLTLAGPDGPDQDYVHFVDSAAQRYCGRAELSGARTGSRLDHLWDSADLLVLPSLAETYGMVVTEAVARGVPALVGAGTGAEEALAAGQPPSIRHRSAGLPGRAVDPTDEAAWTEVLSQWLTRDDVRARWRANAAVHRDRLPTWSDTATQLWTALRW